MSASPVSPNHQPEKLGLPYCSDPDCAYCKELRAVEERIKESTAGTRKSA